jgi:ATP-dependent DNA helicase recG
VPYKALRECCINAFAHRVYHRPGSSVGIAIYDDRVEIENSGTFPPDITIEKLLGGHNSEPQNLIVANVLYKSAVLESWGRGIALMVNECRRVGIPDPEFHTDGNAVWIVFHYTRTTVGQDPTATPQHPYSNPTVTPQLGKLLSAIGNNTLSAKEIMEKTGMKDKRNFLKNYIHPAINSGLVLSLYPIGSKSPQQKYYLTDKGKGFLQQ